MITEQFGLEQMERLKNLDWYPPTKAGENDLLFALMAAATDSIAVAAVNNWVGYSKECPKPAEIRKYIWDENEKVKPPLPPASKNHCKQCNGTGVCGGHIGTKHDREWSACFCPLGSLYEIVERVNQANAARERILRVVMSNSKVVGKKNSAVDPMRSVEEVYRGNF